MNDDNLSKSLESTKSGKGKRFWKYAHTPLCSQVANNTNCLTVDKQKIQLFPPLLTGCLTAFWEVERNFSKLCTYNSFPQSFSYFPVFLIFNTQMLWNFQTSSNKICNIYIFWVCQRYDKNIIGQYLKIYRRINSSKSVEINLSH